MVGLQLRPSVWATSTAVQFFTFRELEQTSEVKVEKLKRQRILLPTYEVDNVIGEVEMACLLDAFDGNACPREEVANGCFFPFERAPKDRYQNG